MGNLAVVNACALSRFAFAELPGGRCAFERVLRCAAGLPGVERLVLFGGEGAPEGLLARELLAADGRPVPVERTERRGWDVPGLVAELGKVSLGLDDSSDLFYLQGDFPLYDSALAARMHESHKRYYAEYTFADGYPIGLSLEILKPGVARELSRLLAPEDGEIRRDALFALIQRDINAFDIETELSPVDLRMSRVQLSCDTLRNFRLVQSVIEAGGVDEASILKVVEKRGELLRTLPAYVEIQITDGVTQEVAYSPLVKLAPGAIERRGEMALERFKRVVAQVKRLADDAVVNLSLWGEPALHSRLPELLEAVYAEAGLSALIETSGVGWRAGVIEEIERRIGNRIVWIVDLDASSPEVYRRLRGEGWEEANAFVERLIALFPGKVYVQATRMTTNEEDLEAFYRAWKGRVANVIIQKYDFFGGFLPQLKVTDISPVRRFPCWHLKRDLVVLIDGTVPMCREDLKREHVLGNAFTEELEVIWDRGQAVHARHVAEDYPALCKACDEYYTYNF